MTRDEIKRTQAALDGFTNHGKDGSGFERNDIRDLMVCLMSRAADRGLDVPSLTNAALKVYGETYGVNV